jgi:hypothetical protein
MEPVGLVDFLRYPGKYRRLGIPRDGAEPVEPVATPAGVHNRQA